MFLVEGFELSQILALWEVGVMALIALGLVYLAIARRFEPLLLVPIGLGILLANFFPDLVQEPEAASGSTGGLLWLLQEYGLRNELFPLLMFLGLGAPR